MARRLPKLLSRPAVPPLPGLSPADRADLVRRHVAEWYGRHTVATYLPYLVAFVFSYRVGPALVRAVPPWGWAAGLLGGIWLGQYVLSARMIGPRVLAELRERGLCAGCGYDLTGNASGVCPECGAVAESGAIVEGEALADGEASAARATPEPGETPSGADRS